MKKLLSIVVLLIWTVASYAQQDVTKFLGIPVDGTESAMIQKLKAKGFAYNSTLDCLKGRFNGTDVILKVVTNNDKVCRIMVRDVNTINETDIRIRFNTLCEQFSSNPKYMKPTDEEFKISDDEDISYGIRIKNKRYQASYYQYHFPETSEEITDFIASYIANNYTAEQIKSHTDDERKEIAQKAFMNAMYTASKHSVWFMIDEDRYKQYRILMFYDNGYNQANGEDL